MALQELFQAGRLAEAIAAQAAQVRQRPGELDPRWQLVVLLAFAGELDRALGQLDTLALEHPESAQGCAVYRGLLAAEAERAAVHAREGQPLLPPACPAHVEARLRALAALRAGDAAAARAELERAEKQRPALSGTIGGKGEARAASREASEDLSLAFEDLRDSDDLLGPVLEVYAGGRYLWLPLERVRRLEVPAPVHRIDLLWAPARLTDGAGGEAQVHLPVLYAGSSALADAPARVGRSTEWALQADLVQRGRGQRMWLVERRGEAERRGAPESGSELEELPLLETRVLEIEGARAVDRG